MTSVPRHDGSAAAAPPPAAAPCERFAAAPGAPPCKENLLRFCNTDLASSIYRWPRFVAEDRGFAKVESHGIGLNDGLLARLLKASGWKVRGRWCPDNEASYRCS